MPSGQWRNSCVGQSATIMEYQYGCFMCETTKLTIFILYITSPKSYYKHSAIISYVIKYARNYLIHTNGEQGGARRRKQVRKGLAAALHDDSK